ncbi:MAG: M48 family metallopeptidase [Acidobacteriaceae bacterium]|nr:M48 family metallopeptidase [Acidobacteriaceae bacterium]
MRLRALAATLSFSVVLLSAPLAHASETAAEHAANVYAAQELASHPIGGNLPDYSLSPADLSRAQHLHTTEITLVAVDTAWSILQLVLLLWLGVVGWMRDVAVRTSPFRWVQGAAFFAIFTVVGLALDLPISLYGHNLALRYGLSVQSWGSWAADQAKSVGLEWIIGTLLIMLLFWVTRKFPRRWWIAFWVVSIPITIFSIFVSPYIGFLYNKYEPLTKNHAQLAQQIKQVVDKGHMDIPLERMYVMQASAKVTTMNADVEGFGSTKRVVVWDTTINKMKPEEVIAVFGHESGHYVLNHIRTGIFRSFAIVFFSLWLMFLMTRWMLARFGATWKIPDQSDWGAVAVLMLSASILNFVLTPLGNTLSRNMEHAADVYGMEAIHGLVPDPQQAMQGAMIDLGKASFDVPNTAHWEEVLLGSHPALGRRAAFAHAYNPWAPGYAPKYFPKQ